jgi:hypothetical protein
MIQQADSDAQHGVRHKNPGGQAAVSAREFQGSFEDEIEEEGIEVVDFLKRICLCGRQVATFHERARTNKSVNGGQWVIASINEPFV